MPVLGQIQPHHTQRTEHRKHSKVDFIIDKRTGAKFKYKEFKNNNDIDEHFNSSMVMNKRFGGS